jgi:hypothetical protein
MRTTFSNTIELLLVVPNSFKPTNPTKGSEFDEEIGVKINKLSHQVIVAISSC